MQEVSDMCGEKIKRNQEGKIIEKTPLVSKSDLQRLGVGEAIIIKQRMYPFRIKLPDQEEYYFEEHKNNDVFFAVSQIKSLSTFDITNYVRVYHTYSKK